MYCPHITYRRQVFNVYWTYNIRDNSMVRMNCAINILHIMIGSMYRMRPLL